MTIDGSSLGPPPPPPSAEAVQLAELRRAELLTIRLSPSSPWWISIVTGFGIAAGVWASSLSLAVRDIIRASARLLLRRKMVAAVRRVEAETFGPPSGVGR